jgi:hypothetical protein
VAKRSVQWAAAGLLLAAAAIPEPGLARVRSLFSPCDGECSVAVYTGSYVEDAMSGLFITDPEVPLTWDYVDDHIAAVAVSRRVWSVWEHLDIEPEIGAARRFGKQDEVEFWGAFFFRYRGFPWDRAIVTTAAISTGVNWASDVSDVEQERAKDQEGAQLQHFFSPEITFALPSRPNLELLFRFHHRSSVFGLMNDSFGAAQYGTVGLRYRF